MGFANGLRRARQRKGLTQQQLGIAMGPGVEIGQSRVSNFETGRSLPNYLQLMAIVHALGLDAGDAHALRQAWEDEQLTRRLLHRGAKTGSRHDP